MPVDFPGTPDASGLEPTARAWAAAAAGPLRWAAVGLAVWMTLRPGEPAADEGVAAEGIALAVALDRSGSMRRPDFPLGGQRVRRIDGVKAVAERLLLGLGGGRSLGRPGDLVGLVTFAGRARTESRPTLDHDLVAAALEDVELAERLRDDGTAVGDGLALAVARLAEAGGPGVKRVAVLLTDGRHNAGRLAPVVAAELAAARGVRTYVVSVRPAGDDPLVWAESDAQLAAAAERTGGRQFVASDAAALAEVIAEIAALERTDVGGRVEPRRREWAVEPWRAGPLGLPPIAAGSAVLAAASVMLRDGVGRRLG